MKKYRKIKDLKISRRGIPRTEKQLEASRKSGIKNMILQNKQNVMLSLRQLGRKSTTEKYKKNLTKKMILNNPMKNFELAKKQHINDKRNFRIKPEDIPNILEELKTKSMTQLAKEKKIDIKTLTNVLNKNGIFLDTKERLRFASLNNPNVRKTWFTKEETIKKNILNNPVNNPETRIKIRNKLKKNYELTNKERDKKICELYNSGKKADEISNIVNCRRTRIYKILKDNNVKRRTQKDYPINYYKKNKKEVKNEENNISIIPFNPAIITN